VPFFARRMCKDAVFSAARKAVPVSQEHHQGVTVAVAVGLGRLDQRLHLIGRQVFAGAQIGVWSARRCDFRFSVAGETNRRLGFATVYALPSMKWITPLSGSESVLLIVI
jgi:hypothetical protein